MLQHRWATNSSRHWPTAPPTLWSRATVRYVMDRWGNQSVISGETNPLHLCIVPYERDKDVVPTASRLVLVTEKEAQSLSRVDNARRAAAFPPSVREVMEQ